MSKKKPRGRPCKLTPELQAKIVTLMRDGNYVETAAACVGINKETLYAWLKKGARGEGGKFKDFSNAVEKAQAEAERRDVQNIGNAAAEGAWQASAWRLERKFPKRWGRMDRTEVTGKDGGPVKVEHNYDADIDLLASELASIAARQATQDAGGSEEAGGRDPQAS